MTDLCPHCGWPDAKPFQVLSRHRTANGMTVWSRCACGSTQVREIDLTGTRILTRGHPVKTHQSPPCAA